MFIEFDDRKDQSNLDKHGVAFNEAASSLLDPMALAREDPHARSEQRWVLVGMSDRARMLTVVYTLRGETIRIISARKATRNEELHYAKGI